MAQKKIPARQCIGCMTYVLPVIVLFIFAFGIYDKFFA